MRRRPTIRRANAFAQTLIDSWRRAIDIARCVRRIVGRRRLFRRTGDHSGMLFRVRLQPCAARLAEPAR